MDGRSQIDILATEDSVVIGLSQDLDDHTNHLRRSVLETVKQMRAKVMQQATDLIDGERTQSRETERRLLSQIDQLQGLLHKRSGELERQRLINDRLVTLHKEQNARAQTKALAKEALRRWHEHTAKKKYREKMAAHITQIREEKESRRIFNAWQLESTKQKHKEEMAAKLSDYKRNVNKLTIDHQSSENKMKLEMLSMKESLAKEEERRAILEERLKAAFMRGVCALNMEAMTVLRNAGAGDADVSIASLLQGMNMTSSTVDSASAEPASTDRLMAQQAYLQHQLNDMASLQQQPSADDRAADGHLYQQQQQQPLAPVAQNTQQLRGSKPPINRDARMSSGPMGQHGPAAPRVTVNPTYPSAAAAQPHHPQPQQRPKSATGWRR